MQRNLIDPWTWQEKFGYHHGHEVVDAPRTLYISGQTASDAEGTTVGAGNMAAQIGQCVRNVETVLKGARMTPANLTRIQIFTTDIDLFFQHAGELQYLFERGSQHTSTVVQVTRLAYPEFMVEIEAEAAA